MLEVKHLLRKAFIDKLAGLTYLGTSIPIDEEEFNITTNHQPAYIGGQIPIQAYLIIKNQTVNDASTKCGVNQDSSLQLDIVTIFDANSGNSLHADLIAQAAFDLLFDTDEQFISLTIADVEVWRSWLESSRTIVENSSTNRTFRNILLFQNSIWQ